MQSFTASPDESPPVIVTEVHSLPDLPYAMDALAPVLGARTLGLHHGYHQRGYVDALNLLLEDEPELARLPLEELVRKTALDPQRIALFQNAAQVWNHTFYWHSMKPRGGGVPTGPLLTLLEAAFGDLARFKLAFIAAGKARFGSGWVWLVHENGRLALETTANADTPMAHGKRCLLTCDVWEHAYYLDHQARRTGYLGAFLEELVDWDFARANLG